MSEYTNPGLFELALGLMLAVTAAVVALRRVGQPPLVAYLFVGVLLGPWVSRALANEEVVSHLGELGVVLLMFTLGLEFNLAKLRSMRQHVFVLGALQVGSTLILSVLMLLLLPAWMISRLLPAEADWKTGFVIGAALAMSSTALITKLLAERRELESEHGRRAFGVLLFQDLAVIPLLIVIPALGGGETLINDLLLALLKAAVLLFVLLRVGPYVMRRWFRMVARQRSHELFTVNVLLASLFFAWLTHAAGLSMELGAFVAGMLIAETEFKVQVEDDIKPFRDLLLGLFFVTIGMKLDVRELPAIWPEVLMLLALIIPLKALLIAFLVRSLKASDGIAIRTAIWLAQAGEFGFVLLGLGLSAGYFPASTMQVMLAAMLLSMLAAPILIQRADWLAMRLSPQDWMMQSVRMQNIASKAFGRSGHVVICGFGRSGQSLARLLRSESVQYLALDTDPDRVRIASRAGEPVVYADSSKREALISVGLQRASALAITFDDTAAAERVLRLVRQLAPKLPVLVRTAHEADILRLREAGATEVIPEIVEGSLMMGSHVMALAGVSLPKVFRRVREVRAARYEMLQGYFEGSDDRHEDLIEHDSVMLRSIEVPEDSAWAGLPVEALMMNDATRLIAVIRQGQRIAASDLVFMEPQDLLILTGSGEGLQVIEERLLEETPPVRSSAYAKASDRGAEP
ncbi:MAG: potassium transporter [Betaproteobacteria bacterium]|nr:potassium transporter [Betaproteobacteria bacterium]NBO43826.1 potassium transporter [Betaproteobacteria bacterium]NBP10192.1 potassium transporter [Betaproteobacteria bacterium]NBP62530.1 potassium transporter [Betaproteobacteria bacterium]NBQ09223.1 potassium transporter [Betaproteobacteria bacterium]